MEPTRPPESGLRNCRSQNANSNPKGFRRNVLLGCGVFPVVFGITGRIFVPQVFWNSTEQSCLLNVPLQAFTTLNDTAIVLIML